MSAPIPLVTVQYVSYTTEEVGRILLRVREDLASQRSGVMRRHIAGIEITGQDYQNWPHKNATQPLGYPVVDPRYHDPAFMRENTLRSLTRWQSLRAGLGFRARKVSEQRLDDIAERNKPQAADGILVRMVKGLRRSAIQSILRSRSNVDSSYVEQFRAKHNTEYAKAVSSYHGALVAYMQNNPRFQTLTNAMEACSDALQSLEDLMKQGVTDLLIDREAGFRRLLVEAGAKASPNTLDMVQELRDFLANDAGGHGLKLARVRVTTINPSSFTRINPSSSNTKSPTAKRSTWPMPPTRPMARPMPGKTDAPVR